MSAVLAAHRPDVRLPLGVAITAGAVLLGIVAALSVTTPHDTGVIVIAWLLLGLVTFRYQAFALPMLVTSATLFEAFPLNFPDSTTDRVSIFLSLSTSAGIPGAKVTAMDMLLAAFLVAWVGRAVAQHAAVSVPGGPLARAVAALAGVLLVAELAGLARGGSLQVSIEELRSWEYMIGTFLVAGLYSRRRGDVLAVLWCIVAGTGIKGVQGTVRYFAFARGAYHNQILGHEEALLFTLFLTLVVALWLFGIRGAMRRTATALTPFVLLADLANNRRTAWIILGLAIIVLLAVGIARRPEQRRMWVAVTVVLAAVAGVYLAAFWHSSSGSVIAKPALAVVSAISPNARDKSSDDYRLLENANLQIDIRSSPLLPGGFGRRVEKTIPMFDATQYDVFIDYIPHNQVLYIWMRLGSLGVLAFWIFIGLAITRSLQLTRARDPRLLAFGVVATVAVLGYVVEAWFDQGLTSSRIAILMGALLGGVAWLLRDRAVEDGGDPEPIPAPVPAGPATEPRTVPAVPPASGSPPSAPGRLALAALPALAAPPAPAVAPNPVATMATDDAAVAAPAARRRRRLFMRERSDDVRTRDDWIALQGFVGELAQSLDGGRA